MHYLSGLKTKNSQDSTITVQAGRNNRCKLTQDSSREFNLLSPADLIEIISYRGTESVHTIIRLNPF